MTKTYGSAGAIRKSSIVTKISALAATAALALALATGASPAFAAEHPQATWDRSANPPYSTEQPTIVEDVYNDEGVLQSPGHISGSAHGEAVQDSGITQTPSQSDDHSEAFAALLEPVHEADGAEIASRPVKRVVDLGGDVREALPVEMGLAQGAVAAEAVVPSTVRTSETTAIPAPIALEDIAQDADVETVSWQVLAVLFAVLLAVYIADKFIQRKKSPAKSAAKKQR